MKKIELEPYKGVRDFFPKENRLHRYILRVWEEVVESFGYEKYNASVLEPLDLYKAKSSEEIVNEQIYSFTDRGDRIVALRPEMTPTVARMVASKWQELPAPVRWYSIPNLFRYEKPQRGRLREHWQLNADIFGISSIEAEIEMITLAEKIMEKFGAKQSDFQIKINSRKAMESVYKSIGLPEDKKLLISRIIDKKDKISEENFKESIIEIAGEEIATKLTYVFDTGEGFFSEFSDNKAVQELQNVLSKLKSRGFDNLAFSPTLTRGFDYYTGVVFEVFDTNTENPRSIFGGGRYDNLIAEFTGESVPAVGFGLGDVTMQNFLETHGLLPKLKSTTDIWLCIAPETEVRKVEELADKIREGGVNVGIDISGKKLPDQLKTLEKRGIPYVCVVGKEELESGKFKLKNTETREEKEVSLEDMADMLK